MQQQHFVQDSGEITPGDLYQYGRYTVIKKLTQGGQGVVVLVKDNKDQVE
jgi:hypothetical protein